MNALQSNTYPILIEQDVVLIRKVVRELSVQLKLSLINQTKLVTAASELTRNIIKYASTGSLKVDVINNGTRDGIQLIFEDKGPGIPDIPRVMKGGYTTGKGLGLGLSGSERLVDEFELKSVVGQGTYIKLIVWK